MFINDAHNCVALARDVNDKTVAGLDFIPLKYSNINIPKLLFFMLVYPFQRFIDYKVKISCCREDLKSENNTY